MATQNHANHRRLVPLYHGVTFGLLVVNLVWSLKGLVADFGTASLVSAGLAVALILLFFFARLFAISVQDRVIRLEMQLRLKEILPPDLRARIGEISRGQFCALRFAGDDEIVELTRWTLDNRCEDRGVIKQRIKNWKADDLRC